MSAISYASSSSPTTSLICVEYKDFQLGFSVILFSHSRITASKHRCKSNLNLRQAVNVNIHNMMSFTSLTLTQYLPLPLTLVNGYGEAVVDIVHTEV